MTRNQEQQRHTRIHWGGASEPFAGELVVSYRPPPIQGAAGTLFILPLTACVVFLEGGNWTLEEAEETALWLLARRGAPHTVHRVTLHEGHQAKWDRHTTYDMARISADWGSHA